MSEHRLADLATKLLRRQSPGAHEVSGPYADRAQIVAVIERTLARRARRRRTLLVGVTGVAAAIIAVFSARLFLLSRTTGELSARLSEGQGSALVHVGDRLLPKAPATLQFDGGTVVAIAAASEVEVLELGRRQRLGLAAGRLRATVNKRRSLEEFSILTPDALVSVRGTEFEVEVAASPACSGGRATRVKVFAGEVAVHHDGAERRLLPSDGWLSPCALGPQSPIPSRSASPPTVPRPAAPDARRAKGPPSPRPAASTSRSAAAIESSTLTDQNELFAQALAARRRGDHTTAITRLDELLTRFPGGPLAEAAARLRRDLLKSTP